CMQGIESPLTF
nr:immunoglobulin light chain junction region [Macaca mulatta]